MPALAAFGRSLYFYKNGVFDLKSNSALLSNAHHNIFKIVFTTKTVQFNIIPCNLVKDILMSNEIDILAMQEIELESTFDINLLSIPGYTLETENTKHKKMVGIYIRNNLLQSLGQALGPASMHTTPS